MQVVSPGLSTAMNTGLRNNELYYVYVFLCVCSSCLVPESMVSKTQSSEEQPESTNSKTPTRAPKPESTNYQNQTPNYQNATG